MATPLSKQIIQRITQAEKSWVFSAHDFLDMGSRDAIDQTLSRLVKEEFIRRLARGLYDKPVFSPLLSKFIEPSSEEIAGALARKTNSKLQMNGAKAANLLRISTQVPARAVYLTDGSTRTVKVRNQTIELRHAAPRVMAGAGEVEGIILQALRHLGEGRVTPEIVEYLKNTLRSEDRQALQKEALTTPSWLLPIVQEIISGETV
jgi:hypothetical protein